MLDWNTMQIDWQGRGWDRGLRGIAFDGETVYIAASDELFAYAPDMRLLGSWRNPYLKHCHEICRYERMLFLASTGFDSILGFDLDRRSFTWGLTVQAQGDGFVGRVFDPELGGPQATNLLHINNVYADRSGLHVSGLRTGGVVAYTGRELKCWVTLPLGVHNARPFRDGVLFNDTQANTVRFASRAAQRSFAVPRYPQETLTHIDPQDGRLARQAFGRGLCVVDEQHIACGSSPSTIVIHDLRPGGDAHRAQLSHDVRNAIHGLEVWPFSWPAGQPTSIDVSIYET